MACVGWTYQQCVARYGLDGFDSMSVSEQGMDRADMERVERCPKVCFVELRADKRTGRILGCTACGQAAAEITNSMGIAIVNGLTVADVAMSAHSYPSFGYLLYRIALSMALSSTWGVLESCGPIAKVISKAGRFSATTAFRANEILRLPRYRNRVGRLREWQAQGAGRALYLRGTTAIIDGSGIVQVVSYLDASRNTTLSNIITEYAEQAVLSQSDYANWLRIKP
jgi:Pyridine nucleotide-disulphide oxidoreductase, dimerisation domain